MELAQTSLALDAQDFEHSILFLEDIPEFFDELSISNYFDFLGENGFLQKLVGIIIGKVNENKSFESRAELIRHIVSEVYCCDFPIMYGLNFGHSSPMIILPYGAMAEIDCDNMTFKILESGVV